MPLVYLDQEPPSQYAVERRSQHSNVKESTPREQSRPGRKAPAQENGLAYDQSMSIINHEFRALQLDKSSKAMSIFDLIDKCATLFEELSRKRHTDEGLRCYIRAYLIFNYFVNTFIMVHFNGFATFMETSHQDFIIYLNLYNFFRTDDIMGDAFEVDLRSLRLWVVQYLTLKDLLNFDVDLLYGWLDEYVEYLKNKDNEASNGYESSDSDLYENETNELHKNMESHEKNGNGTKNGYYRTDANNLYSLSAYLDDSASDTDDLFDFNSRFPEVEAKAPYPVTDKAAAVPTTPYPVKSTQPQPQQKYSRPAVVVPKRNLDLIPLPADYSRSLMQAPARSSTFPVPREPIPAPAYQQTVFPPSFQPQSAYPQPQSQLIVHQQHQQHPKHQQHHQQLYPHAPPGHVPPQYMSPPIGHDRSFQDPQRAAQMAHQDETQRKLQWIRSHAICGLRNLGSSCYINLTIQVLFGLKRFDHFFLRRYNPALGDIIRASKKPVLSTAVSGLLETFDTRGGTTIGPGKFLKVLSQLKLDFNIPNEQQDAQEFLLFLLDKLHEELAVKPVDPMAHVNKLLLNVSATDREEYLKWYSNLVEHEGESPISDMFQGHVQSRLVCNKCGYKSLSYSPFSILSLPIPSTRGNGVDLTDCLRYFTQDEVLSGENAWHCPKCNKDGPRENPMDVVFQPKRGMFRMRRSKSPSKKPATVPAPTSISIKQLSFVKLPPVLFIHLSRFSMYNLTDKLDTDITYPLRLNFNHATHDVYYSLTGVINHYGNLKSGHYTSLVNKASFENDRLVHPYWCYFDDDHVKINVAHGDITRPETSKLRSRDVYVLCYERV